MNKDRLINRLYYIFSLAKTIPVSPDTIDALVKLQYALNSLITDVSANAAPNREKTKRNILAAMENYSTCNWTIDKWCNTVFLTFDLNTLTVLFEELVRERKLIKTQCGDTITYKRRVDNSYD